MDLIKHELYKIFSNKIIYIVVLLFIILNIVYFYTKSNVYDNELSQKYNDYNGKITEEKYNDANKNMSALMQKCEGSYIKLPDSDKVDYNLYMRVIQAMDIKQSIESEINDLETSISTSSKDTYKYKDNLSRLNLLKKISTPHVLAPRGYDNIINFINRYGMIFIGALILLGLSSVFCNEYSSNMDSLILSTKYGKTKIVTAKLIASSLYILILIAALSLSNFILNVFTIYDPSGWSAPLQSISGYEHSPYNVTILQYYIMQIGIHLFGSIVFALVVLTISSISKNVLVPFFISGGIFFTPLLLEYMFGPITDTSFTLFSFNDVMKVDTIINKYQAFDIFNSPVLYPVLIIVIYLILAILLIFGIYKSFSNHQVSN